MVKPSIRIRDFDIHLTNLETRMPFKYGIATMTRVPHAFVRVHAEIDGALFSGIAADLLPPKWFTKDPEKAVIDEIAEMIRVIRHAASRCVGLTGATTFEVWQQLYKLQDEWAAEQKLPPLLAHFGTSLIERGLIEAVCRASQAPFAELLGTNRFGVRLNQIHPALGELAPGDFLSTPPLERIILRHTVGLVDPLRDEHIPSESKLSDGLPQSLAACIKAYDLRHFKIKVTGHLDHDLDRLEQIAEVLGQEAKADYRFSLDGNEQFKSLADFRSFWNAVTGHSKLQEFLKHLLFVEQPLHREVALQPSVGEMFARWPDRPPVIIDESDAALRSLPSALRLGYAGTSHKNCKGIFKSIANRCLLIQQEREEPRFPRIMSGEDLCTIGPVSVLQDLAVMAALGIESVERNGHHYFPGLSMFSKEIQQQVLAAHNDVYRQTAFGWPALSIQGGAVKIGSLNKNPLGVGFVVDVEKFTPVEEFQPRL
jgi:L-alanine-DL-glutamate epimerase-like enolase superfamily enzyme